MRTTYLGEIVAKQLGLYSVYVIKNLDENPKSLLRYITLTVLPNWNFTNLDIGTTGYFECEYTNAGDSYFKKTTQTNETYNYTACYLINYIKKDKQIIEKEFNF